MKESFPSPTPDPSRSSLVEENLGIQKVRGREFRDTVTHEDFFVVHKNPEFQRLVSYLAKGTINTSDVVKQGDRYFSHKQQLDTVAPGNAYYKEEMRADTFILRYLFGDYDHEYYPAEDYRMNDARKEANLPEEMFQKADIEHQNVVVNQANKNAYYFDFDSAASLGLTAGEGIHSISTSTEENKKKFIWTVERALSTMNQQQGVSKRDILSRRAIYEIIQRKTAEFGKNIFSPEQFPTFMAMFERSGTRLDERSFQFYDFKSDDPKERISQLFEDFCERCSLIHTAAQRAERSIS